ncbi:MAG: class I SAM-dependent methyltransferase [Elstera sp.]
MSGFSADWLDLRAPADAAARDAGLLAEVARLAPRRILDLGCGTGAMLATLRPHLAPGTSWVLVDGDAGLLEEAACRGAALRERDPDLNVTCLHRNLVEDPLPLAGALPDLVTATALFDLVSAPWLERFLDALAARRLPLYAALSYDGVMRWEPTHSRDAEITAAFNRHQQTEKGFVGPALGPLAPGAMQTGLEARGYRVLTARSPWRVGPEQAAMIAALIDGIASAAQEEGSVSDWQDWQAARQAETRLCVIGHTDLLALPG